MPNHDRSLRGGRNAAVIALALPFLVAACASREAPLALPHGHPADPATRGTPAADPVTPAAEPAAAAAPAPAPSEGVTYACPMHPEVTSPSPGKCPKCGMALRPAKSAGTPGGGQEGHQ